MKKDFLHNHLALSEDGSPQEREEATHPQSGAVFLILSYNDIPSHKALSVYAWKPLLSMKKGKETFREDLHLIKI